MPYEGYLPTSVRSVLDCGQQWLELGVEGNSEGTVDDSAIHLKESETAGIKDCRMYTVVCHTDST